MGAGSISIGWEIKKYFLMETEDIKKKLSIDGDIFFDQSIKNLIGLILVEN